MPSAPSSASNSTRSGCRRTDDLETFQEFAGAGLLGIALIVFWRMFAFILKDRDFYRDTTFMLLSKRDGDLDTLKQAVKPLRKVGRAVKSKQPEVSKEEIVRQFVRFLEQA